MVTTHYPAGQGLKSNEAFARVKYVGQQKNGAPHGEGRLATITITYIAIFFCCVNHLNINFFFLPFSVCYFLWGKVQCIMPMELSLKDPITTMSEKDLVFLISFF